MKVDYNIEFSHIYADEYFGEEQIKSIEILKKVIKRMHKNKKTFVTSVMVDDFNTTTSHLDIEKLIKTIKSYDVPLDFVVYESKLGKIGDSLLGEIPTSRLKLEYFHKPQKEVLFLKEKNDKISLNVKYGFSYKHTCALLSAAWSLSRLGIYHLPNEYLIQLEGNQEFKAKKIITILPKKYEKGEKNVLDIIRSTKFKGVLKDIEYVFY